MASLVWVVWVVMLVLLVVLLRRNNQVYHERWRVLEHVSALAKADINADRDWIWRYEVLRRVTYNEMVRQFWRPVSSFFADAPELRLHNDRGESR